MGISACCHYCFVKCAEIPFHCSISAPIKDVGKSKQAKGGAVRSSAAKANQGSYL